jgi:hypothetical protein
MTLEVPPVKTAPWDNPAVIRAPPPAISLGRSCPDVCIELLTLPQRFAAAVEDLVSGNEIARVRADLLVQFRTLAFIICTVFHRLISFQILKAPSSSVLTGAAISQLASRLSIASS